MEKYVNIWCLGCNLQKVRIGGVMQFVQVLKWAVIALSAVSFVGCLWAIGSKKFDDEPDSAFVWGLVTSFVAFCLASS